MLRRHVLRSTDPDGTTIITFEFNRRDLDRLDGLPVFLKAIESAWVDLMDSNVEEDPGLVARCDFPDCDMPLTPVDVELGESRCESHLVDEWGVPVADCYCDQSPVDNMDVYVCEPHKRAWRRNPSSFQSS